MARKLAPGTLIHCDACGEDYSATYKRCPFCGEKPEAWATAPIPRLSRSAPRRQQAERYDNDGYDDTRHSSERYDSARYDDTRYDDARYDDARYGDTRYDDARRVSESRVTESRDSRLRDSGRYSGEAYDDDEYIFDGSDVFEDGGEYEDDPEPRQGGRRLPQTNALGPVNWPRMITFICSLVIVAAALIIVFAYVYPKIHDPGSNAGKPSAPPVSEPPEQSAPVQPSPDLSTQDPDASNTEVADPNGDPTADPSADVTAQPPASPAPQPSGVTGLSLDKSDFTLEAGGQYTLTATVTPSGWNGTVSWSSSNTNIATVDQNGRVTNVNNGDEKYRATITATAGDRSVTCIVRCNPGSGSSSSGTTPAPQETASSSSGSGSLTLNKSDFTLILGDSVRGSTRMSATGADSVTWSISNSAVATIDSNGRVTAVGSGMATITAAASDGRTATCIVRVK